MAASANSVSELGPPTGSKGGRMPTDDDKLREKVKRWRLRAEECRTIAHQMKSVQGRLNLLDVAEAYEKMAHRAEPALPYYPGKIQTETLPSACLNSN